MLNGAVSNHLIGKYLLPTALWPRAEFQTANRTTAAVLGTKGPLLRDAALAEGFNTNALVLTEELVRTWARAGESTIVLLADQSREPMAAETIRRANPGRMAGHGPGLSGDEPRRSTALAGLSRQLAQNDALLSGWELLGNATLKRVQSRMWLVVTPMVVLVLLSLWFAFRRATEILLGMAVLCLSGLCLLAIMAVSGWTWNLMNLMALPLMLGTGVDYTIFMQLALRRHGGDLVIVRRSVGRALMLCGGTARGRVRIAGIFQQSGHGQPGQGLRGGHRRQHADFGFSAAGVVAIVQSEVQSPKSKAGRQSRQRNLTYASPVTRHSARFLSRRSVAARIGPRANPAGRIGERIRHVGWPIFIGGFSGSVAKWWCKIFCLLFAGDRVAAEKAARRLHRNFAAKLVDLWRVESGVPVRNWLTNDGELEIIRAARQRGHGTLFITLHLGNWEHGGLLLTQLGIRLTILTQAEPDDGLTDLRIEARRRCGVETLIIGQDDFAFVEVIKQLQAGADLAISLDRPPERGGVPVEFFGHRLKRRWRRRNWRGRPAAR